MTSLEVSLIGEEKLGLINGRRRTTLRDIPQAGSKNRATFSYSQVRACPWFFRFPAVAAVCAV